MGLGFTLFTRFGVVCFGSHSVSVLASVLGLQKLVGWDVTGQTAVRGPSATRPTLIHCVPRW